MCHRLLKTSAPQGLDHTVYIPPSACFGVLYVYHKKLPFSYTVITNRSYNSDSACSLRGTRRIFFRLIYIFKVLRHY
jgi:hypothetical protein